MNLSQRAQETMHITAEASYWRRQVLERVKRIGELEQALRPLAELPVWHERGFGAIKERDVLRARLLLGVGTPPPPSAPRAGLCRFGR